MEGLTVLDVVSDVVGASIGIICGYIHILSGLSVFLSKASCHGDCHTKARAGES